MPRLRPVPWLIVLQTGVIAGEHWRQLSTRERTRLRQLIGKSRGRPSNLSAREREEVRRLVAKLDVPGAGRKLLPFAARRGRGPRP